LNVQSAARQLGSPSTLAPLVRTRTRVASSVSVWPGFARRRTLRAAPAGSTERYVGARHAACAWGSYAWPNADVGGSDAIIHVEESRETGRARAIRVAPSAGPHRVGSAALGGDSRAQVAGTSLRRR
jgi:hypothetical protein